MKPFSFFSLQAFLALSCGHCGAAAAPSAPPTRRMIAFSWEHVQCYMHIRKDEEFTPDEIRYLATFPLVTFEKSTGHKDSGSVEAGTLKAAKAVKEINPVTKILYYRNVIVNYGGYAANESLDHMPGAFLVGKGGSDKLVRDRVQAYDLTNEALRKWWLSAAEKVCDDPAMDGLFLDGMVKILEPGYLSKDIGREKKVALLAGYETMMRDTRQMLGPDKLMVANVLRARFPDSGLSAMKAFDGSYIEGFEGTMGKMPRKDYVAKGMAAFQNAARQGSLIAFTCGLGENLQDADENPQAISEIQQPSDRGDRFTYMLAMFLICAENYSYIDIHDSYDAKTSKIWMTHRPEFDRPLGEPKGAAVRAGYIYTREFAHASVRLDIEKQTGNIVWHDALKK